MEKIGNENVTYFFSADFVFEPFFTHMFRVTLEINARVQEYFYVKYQLLFFDFNKIWYV